MQPITSIITLPTYDGCVKMANIIRRVDETADITIHESKKGMNWVLQAYLCVPPAEVDKLKSDLVAAGAVGTFGDSHLG